jgi:hypothetical protein
MAEIKISVLLPMYRAEKIGWLALESLRRQVEPHEKWEVIIVQEIDQSMCSTAIEEYLHGLRAIECKRVVIKYISDWVPLSQK